MKKILLSSLLVILYLFLIPSDSLAIEDPLSRPNNKIGIHILFPTEVEDAAKLINSNGGDWGYVTIPIQSGDRDIEKWQKFMDECKRLRVIPLIRLATEGDYFNTKVWREPKHEDVIDFANFLHSLQWPTKNKYVMVFNEVNRGDEWGGAVNPAEYADILSYAVTVFKSKSQDFFIISAGLDNAAPNEGLSYMNQYDYMRRMNDAVPGIFNQIDGLNSHSYPNPAFSQPPSSNTKKSIYSFTHERDLVATMSNKKLPIFITETGWTAESVDDKKRAAYYNEAFSGIWQDEGIVAITPFLLRANGGPFTIFSFLKDDNSKTLQYEAYEKMPKVQGNPVLVEVKKPEPKKKSNVRVLGAANIRDFSEIKQKKKKFSLQNTLQSAFKWIMKI